MIEVDSKRKTKKANKKLKSNIFLVSLVIILLLFVSFSFLQFWNTNKFSDDIGIPSLSPLFNLLKNLLNLPIFSISSGTPIARELDGFPAGCMDKRNAWNTSYNPYKLYIKSTGYDVLVNEIPVAMYIDFDTPNNNPYILLDLQKNQELSFEIKFTNSSGYSYIETKAITYDPLCEGDCYLSPALAGEEYTDINIRDGNNILFDRADLRKLMSYENSDNELANQIYKSLKDKIWVSAGTSEEGVLVQGSIRYAYPLIENMYYDGVISNEDGDGNFTIDFPLPIPNKFNIETFQYIKVLDGNNAGKYQIIMRPNCNKIDIALNGIEDTYRCKLNYWNYRGSIYINMSILPNPSIGTNIRLFKMSGGMQNILCWTAIGYKLKQEGWQGGISEDAVDAYYSIIKEILLLDPMLGSWESSSGHNAKCWAIGYDAIKERLIEEDIDNGTNYNEQIRMKMATLLDWWTTKELNYNYNPDYNMAYIYSSEAIIANVLADFIPPKGTSMTGPREWIDRLLFKYNNYINLYFSGQEGNSGPEYGETSSGDVLVFALAHKRVTGKDVISESPIGDYSKTRFKLQFGDLGQPSWGPSPQIVTQRLSAFQNNYFFTDIHKFKEMVEWGIQKAMSQPNPRNYFYSFGTSFIAYALLYDINTMPESPELVMQSNKEWLPTQFIPEANEVMFRDNWNYSSRNFFFMGKPDNEQMPSYYKSKFFYNGHVRYYEDGEHFFGSDPVDPRVTGYNETSSIYRHAILLSDGFYSASYKRVDEPTGTMKHKFSYYNDQDYFVQTSQINAYYLVPGENIENIKKSLNESMKKLPRDLPLPINMVNIYPDDVNYSRQVLFLKDYIILFDNLVGEREHIYEMTLPTYRPEDEVYVSGNKVEVAGVESKGFNYKRYPQSTAYTYKPSSQAGRIARIQTLGNYFTKENYTPANEHALDANAYIKQSITAQNAQFLTIVSSDSNQISGDELSISEISISNGKAATLIPPSEDYEDVLIAHDSQTQNTKTNNVDFTGLLGIVRVEDNLLKDFYVKKGTSLSYDGRDYFSGDVYQISLSYVNSNETKGFVEMENQGEIRVYSEFNPVSIQLEVYDEFWPDSNSNIQNLDFTYNSETKMVFITIPKVRGLLKISNLEFQYQLSQDLDTNDSEEESLDPKVLTYILNDEQITIGASRALKLRDKIKFSINSEDHLITLKDFTKKTSTITIFSDPIEATLILGDSRRFDLDNDGYYEILIKLENIEGEMAEIFIMKIHELRTPQTEKQEKEKEFNAIKLKSKEETTENPFLFTGNKLIDIVLVITYVLIFIVIFIILYIYFKNRSDNKLRKNSI
jgi:hypothetical protein